MAVQPVSRVVIVGGGTAGWMSAALLSKAFAGRLSVELIESDEIGIVGVGEATIPQIAMLNDFLGLEETDFLARTNGSIKLGIEFVNWGRLGDRYLHAFGQVGQDMGGLAGFHHHWLRARALGQAGDLWDYSLNAVAAGQNKFDPSVSQLQRTAAHAYHFDAALYARFLRAYAEQRGVQRTEGKIVDVTLNGETGHVASVTLECGREVAGELFLDCSGFRGLLIEGALKTGYENWSDMLPCDRALAVPCESVTPLTPYTRSTARKAGWQWRIPLQHRIGNGHVYCSSFISDDEAAAVLLANLDGKALADPKPLRFATGKRKKAWNRNVVSLGLASGFLEPLESTSIHLIQSGLARLMQLFPNKDFNQADIDQFNEETDVEYLMIRDFLVLHYHLNQRTDSPFWIHCREMAVPESLTHRLALFAANGRIHQDRRDLFFEPSWLQVLVGQNLIPSGYNPIADTLDPAELASRLASIKGACQQAAARMAGHLDWLNRNAPARYELVTPKAEAA
jgi:tryptophan 7-halogenase